MNVPGERGYNGDPKQDKVLGRIYAADHMDPATFAPEAAKPFSPFWHELGHFYGETGRRR